MKHSIKLGIIGCGTAARDYHWKHWDRLSGARVTAVTDLRADLAQAAAERFGACVYSSYQALIDDADIDALYILIPPFAHTDQELLAVRRGLPFFVEKPVAMSLQKGREVAAAVRERALITSVGYQWRYSAPVDRAKALLGDRKIALIYGYWLGSAASGNLPAWWGKRSRSGGQLVEQSTHIVDLLRYLGGEVRAVYSYQARRLLECPEFDVADAGVAVLHFAGGAIGTVVNACCLPTNAWRAGLEVTAAGMFLEITRCRLVIWQGGEPEQYALADDSLQNPYLREDQIFIDAVRTGDGSAIRSTYPDALRSLAISLAANESADTGQPVELPADL